ncbi:cation:proton antiporter [Ligilactobacillus equi]|uniref:monovalent cation:proton antiporter family protein n=1 Tax=Ligilactobacillus equi TaxID=137357 RepID=UPI002ED45859
MVSLSFVIVALAAFAVPMILTRFKISAIPASVGEVVIGILLGQSALNIVHTSDLLSNFSTFGLLVVMFLSGMEIDFSLFAKNSTNLSPLEAKQKANEEKVITPLFVALITYGLVILGAFLVSLSFYYLGLFDNIALATIMFMTISLAIVVSVLKENEVLNRPFGQTVLLVAILGQVVPMIALTVYSSLIAGKGGSLWLIAILVITAAFMFRNFRTFFDFFERINKATTQVDVRLAFFILLALVWVAEHVGAQNILGAFIAGIVFKLLQPAEDTERRLDAIGYGFFVPFFFIMTGVGLNLPGLLASKKTVILIPLILLAFVLAKLPAFLGLKLRFSSGNSLAASFLSSTTLALILAALTIAKGLEVVTEQQAGAFTVAAILTYLVGPVLFGRIFRVSKENPKKTQVHFIGVNLLTVSTAQQLDDSLYEVNLYTDVQKSFKTFNSEANVHAIDSVDADYLIKNDVLDTDILVLGYSANPEVNYNLALRAKEYGIKRVIMRFDNVNPEIDQDHESHLQEAGVEFFTTFDLGVSSMRAMVESPSMLEMLTSSDARLYEVTIQNANFDGLEIRNLPLVDKITISRIFRNHKAIAPHGNTRIMLGDHMVFSGNKEFAQAIRNSLGKENE